MILHFAYGSNMNRAVMGKHAPLAEPVGVAALSNYRFVITADGYASIERKRRQTVYGVLWRLTPRDRATLDGWENIAGGLYTAETLPVLAAGRRRMALTYVGRPLPLGRSKTGYMELVIAAALEWHLPPAYVYSLRRWLPRGPAGAGSRRLEEFGWT